MKIIVPVVDTKDAKLILADGFHRTECACIYDEEKQEFEWLQTSDIAEFVGELGMELKLMGVEKVISKQMPLMALGLFVDSGIEVYQACDGNVLQNIEKLNNDELAYYSYEESKALASCSGSCRTCDSDCK